MTQEATPLLELRQVSRGFELHRGIFQRAAGRLLAVDEVSLSMEKGETLGLVGESGCGKSTLARLVMRLLPPDTGDILFKGKSLLDAPFGSDTARQLQMIFQDPFSSLNPRLSVGASVGEPLHAAGFSARERHERVAAIFEQVGLSPDQAVRYPHEFSGGQRQRIAIARALILHPEFVVCDEAVSALDASVQAQILNLLKDMQERFGFSYLFISHDLAVVGYMCDRVAVMYWGRIVEIAPRSELFHNPLHPYAKALLAAAPSRLHRRRAGSVLAGEIPNALHPPGGCAFHPRCPNVMDVCRTRRPVLAGTGESHMVACHQHQNP